MELISLVQVEKVEKLRRLVQRLVNEVVEEEIETLLHFHFCSIVSLRFLGMICFSLTLVLLQFLDELEQILLALAQQKFLLH